VSITIVDPPRPPYPSDEVLIRAGKASFDWVIDIGDCHFCDYTTHRGTHDEECPLFHPAGRPL
jgi:hypothetical protein